jgi:arsenite methyltransferase
MYAGCVSGASQMDDYLAMLSATGFENVIVQSEKRITLPSDLLRRYLSDEEITAMHASPTGIFSITVYGQKPTSCCDPGSGCC